MIDLQQKLQANILDRLKRRKDQRLTRGKFEKAIEVIKKQLQADTDTIEQVVEALLREEYVSRNVRGTYQLDQKGVDYLARLESTLSGPAPEINEELLAFQKAFVLMQLFCAKDNSLPQARLREKLSSAAACKALLFARMSSAPPGKPRSLDDGLGRPPVGSEQGYRGTKKGALQSHRPRKGIAYGDGSVSDPRIPHDGKATERAA